VKSTLAEPAKAFNEYDGPHADLREFLDRSERAGELLRVPNVDWNLEMGALAEAVCHAKSEAPAILFENVPGYPGKMRVLSGATNSSKRLALTLGFPVPSRPLDVVQSYRDRMKTHQPIRRRTLHRHRRSGYHARP
jgi:4-hydroxy-3-polyprenylbenzoate decarboxylase